MSHFLNPKNEADKSQMIQVERAEEKQQDVESATERKPEDLLDRETGFQREGTEREGETDEDPEREADRRAECETQTEDTCASTSNGPSSL